MTSSFPQKIAKQLRRRYWLQAFLIALLFPAVAAVLSCVLPAVAATWTLLTGGILLPITLLTAAWRRPDVTGEAAKIDRQLSTSNQLEAALELASGDHPLAAAQCRSAESCFRRDHRQDRLQRQLRNAGFGLLVLLCLTASLTFLSFRHIAYTSRQEAPAQARNENQTAGPTATPPEKEAEQPDPPAIPATLTLTYPEEDPGFKPIDLIEFEGRGEAPDGFRSIQAVLSRNGENVELRELDLAAAKRDGGILFPADALALDDYGTEPYDLMALQLQGTLTNGKHLYSETRFFRIKPLREELPIVDLPGGGAAYEQIDLFLERAIQREIKLNDLFHFGRTTLNLNPRPDLEAFQLLADEQEKLRKELNHFLQAELNRTDTLAPLTPLMVEAINAAIDAMREAEIQLRAVPESSADETAGKQLLGAIAQLNRARREMRRAINRNRDAGSPSSKPDAKPSKNPLDLLKQAIQTETELLEQLPVEAAELPPEYHKRQTEVSWCLRLLQERGELPESQLQQFAAALGCSLAAESAIQSNAPTAFRVKANEALERMRQAQDSLRRDRARANASALSEARQELRKGEEQAAAQGEQTAGESASNAAQKAGKKLEKAAREEQQAGEKKTAEQLADAGKKLEKNAEKLAGLSGKSAAEKLAELRRELNDLQPQPGDKDPAKLAKTIRELAKELEFQQKHGGLTGGNATEWRNDSGRALDAADTLIQESNAGHSGELKQLLPTLQRQMNQLFLGKEPDAVQGERLRSGLHQLAQLLELEAAARELPLPLFQFAPEQIPEEYREATARYFEALSRYRAGEEKTK